MTRLTRPANDQSEHKDTHLVQTRSRVDFDIGTPPLGNFVRYHLECAHGDLGLNSRAGLPPDERRKLPPNSPLGRALRASGDQETIEKHVHKLIDQTHDNIAIALLHLEHLRFAKTVGDVGALSDRLPRHIVSSFDAGIEQIRKTKDDLRRKLGMRAIQLVGKSNKPAGLLFSDLRESIMDGWWPSTEKTRIRACMDSEDAVELVLSASNGFLQMRPNESDKDDVYISCFHLDFDAYVAEDYGDTLGAEISGRCGIFT